MKNIFSRVRDSLKAAGAFSVGVFVGVCYGSVVATLMTYAMLSQ